MVGFKQIALPNNSEFLFRYSIIMLLNILISLKFFQEVITQLYLLTHISTYIFIKLLRRKILNKLLIIYELISY